jgi:hypothetical protein
MRPMSYFARDPNRPAPTPSRMADILASRTKDIVPCTPVDKKLIAAGHLKQHERIDIASGEISATSNEGAKRDNAEAEPRETSVREALSQPLGTSAPLVQLPAGYDPKADAPTLEWLPVQQHANGEATQVSTGGTYSVLGRRTPEGFRYYSRHGISPLGTHMTATDGRTRCLLHHIEQASG